MQTQDTTAADQERRITALLRREAQRCGLLEDDAGDAGDAAPDGAIDVATMQAIEALIERDVQVSEPDEAACRRHYAAQAARYSTGEQVKARHILFAITPGMDLNALRKRAEQCLLDLRADPQQFASQAARLSNCPSGAQGGELGWLTRDDCAAAFARELFGHVEVGVLPRLVHTQFGLHVVEVQAREQGALRPFEQVRAAVSMALKQHSFATALHRYVQRLSRDAGDDQEWVPLQQ